MRGTIPGRSTTLSSASSGDPPLRNAGSSGVYGLAEQRLLEAGGTRLSAFAQLGRGDERVDRFDAYAGGGLVAAGLTRGRPGDELGLGVAAAHNGSPYLDGQRRLGNPVRSTETTLELTFLVRVATWLALQPDLQYVIAPNTSALHDALTLQLSFELTL